MFITGVTILVGTGVAMILHASLPKPALKGKIMRLFNQADLYKKRMVKQVHGPDYVKKIFPKVKTITLYDTYKHVSIVIPDGMNPKEINDRYWLFEQGFGQNISLSGDSKTFNLLIFDAALQSYHYDVEEIKQAIAGYKLPIIAGKDHQGYVVYDMTDEPHLLIAGETGSGKSVQLRSILTTLVTMTQNVDLYLADLKLSEFHLFKGIAKQVEFEVPQVHAMLIHIKREMKKRGKLLNELEVAHVNDIPASKRPNYIVVCIDEFSLLKKENETLAIIEEISSIGRALGIFLILSTQRPDHKIMEGKLKNNLTVRMAFRHKDAINSRISLDSEHAATIRKSTKGRHFLALDELFQVQAPLLTLDKAKELLKPYKKKGEIKQHDIISNVDYEVLGDDDDILELGGYNYVEE